VVRYVIVVDVQMGWRDLSGCTKGYTDDVLVLLHFMDRARKKFGRYWQGQGNDIWLTP
jgi:hypothetical protein